MIQVILISKTEVSPEFLQLTQTTLARHIGRGLDEKGLKFSFISALGEMQREGSDPIETQREAGGLLRHSHASLFVVAAEGTLYEIVMSTGLAVVAGENPPRYHDVGVISGNMEEWRNAIINGCTVRASPFLREFTSKALVAFDRHGMSRLFEMYTRQERKDGTLLLTYKG